ncbi:MAG: hypothetical protein HZC04_00665 [Candidatus Lloydbacteria bacterium]|nr:hypothetical protein [Candidatus Lloydbacteria bacterium]
MTGNNPYQKTISGGAAERDGAFPVSAKRGGCAKHLVVFLLGFALGFGSLWLWNKNNAVSLNKNSNETKGILFPAKEAKENVDGAANEKDRNRIVVVSQEAGSLVVITEVQAEAPTWVAIHEDVDGKPANILGAQLFDAGVHSGTVALLRNTEPGRTYHALLYKDNGDRVFDYVVDLPVESASEMVVSASFATTPPSIPL